MKVRTLGPRLSNDYTEKTSIIKSESKSPQNRFYITQTCHALCRDF